MDKSKTKLSKGLGNGVIVFMIMKLIIGLVIFFTSHNVIKLSPYDDISSIIGGLISLTSGITISLKNIFKDWNK